MALGPVDAPIADPRWRAAYLRTQEERLSRLWRLEAELATDLNDTGHRMISNAIVATALEVSDLRRGA